MTVAVAGEPPPGRTLGGVDDFDPEAAARAVTEAPPWPWTVTVNGHARGALGTPMNQSAGVPLFDVTSGEKLMITVTVTVPAHSTMTKLFLGITGGSVSVEAPSGPGRLGDVLVGPGD